MLTTPGLISSVSSTGSSKSPTRPVTRANAGLKPSWGEVKSLTWKSDQFRVQGWLLYPHAYDSKRRYPMIVSVHGGPAWIRTPNWPGSSFDFTLLSHEDYFVLFPNPRGSYGQGEAFMTPAVNETMVVFGADDGKMYGLKRDTGSKSAMRRKISENERSSERMVRVR